MTFLKMATFAALALMGSAAMSSVALASITVTNNDGKAHVLVVEDEQENITEMPISIGQTIDNLCDGGCFIWLKDLEDAQYVAPGTTGSMIIKDNHLAPAS